MSTLQTISEHSLDVGYKRCIGASYIDDGICPIYKGEYRSSRKARLRYVEQMLPYVELDPYMQQRIPLYVERGVQLPNISLQKYFNLTPLPDQVWIGTVRALRGVPDLEGRYILPPSIQFGDVWGDRQDPELPDILRGGVRLSIDKKYMACLPEYLGRPANATDVNSTPWYVASIPQMKYRIHFTNEFSRGIFIDRLDAQLLPFLELTDPDQAPPINPDFRHQYTAV